MALRKQQTTGEGTTSKGKPVAVVGNIILLSSLCPIVKYDVSAPSQGATGDIHLPSTYKTRLLQMVAHVKEELAKQQALFDHERGRAEPDRENAVREWEEMKRLND